MSWNYQELLIVPHGGILAGSPRCWVPLPRSRCPLPSAYLVLVSPGQAGHYYLISRILLTSLLLAQLSPLTPRMPPARLYTNPPFHIPRLWVESVQYSLFQQARHAHPRHLRTLLCRPTITTAQSSPPCANTVSVPYSTVEHNT